MGKRIETLEYNGKVFQVNYSITPKSKRRKKIIINGMVCYKNYGDEVKVIVKEKQNG